jgi:NodT family efflux transporter outer membrane factor (OMF) lipoprotein
MPVGAALAALALAGCALTPPTPAPAPELPPAWSAPLPPAHDGSGADLARWWSQFDDPLLAQLVDSAQRADGDLAQAAARIDAARAQARAAGARALPALEATAALSRAQVELPPPATLATSYGAGLDLLWEVDVFGVTRNAAAAAQARAAAAGAEWHDLRVTLAAETAARYVDLRACEALVAVYADDARSQRRTAELTRIKAEAGLESPANAALATASAADASNRLIGQQADCDVLVKSLVALTAIPEPALRQRLAARPARLPVPAQFAVQALPARLLMQRPDLRALEHQVQAAASEQAAAQADRYPRLSLAGAITLAGARAGGVDVAGSNWSIGPALVVPLFDAGRRAAQAEAAAAREREARARFEQRAREAVREVEQALVRLDAAGRREADARVAAAGFRRFFEAAQARFEAGVESVLDLESARRHALAAAAALVGVERERVAAWVTLYRAVGGGWVDEVRAPDSADAAPAAQVLAERR